MKTYSSEGFVIARKKFSEADRILILFTKDFGKLSLMAKGVRKLTSRKRGGIEIFTKIKFSAVSGKSLDILTEVVVLESYDKLRRSLSRVGVAYYFCEVIGRITSEEEKHENLFYLFGDYLKKLETSKNLKQLRFNFVKDVLVSIGFWPLDKKMDNPDLILESVTERKMVSSRVGKKMLQEG